MDRRFLALPSQDHRGNVSFRLAESGEYLFRI